MEVHHTERLNKKPKKKEGDENFEEKFFIVSLVKRVLTEIFCRLDNGRSDIEV